MRKCFLFLFLPLIAHSVFLGCNKLPQLGPATESDLATASQEDCGYVQNSYGQRVSWKTSLPIHMFIHTDFPAQFEVALTQAAQQWEKAAGMTLFTFERVSAGTSNAPAFDSRNTIYYLTDWEDSQRNMQAVTSLRWYGNSITDADLKIDARFYNFYVSSAKSTAEIHLQSLLVHELGHVLGLKHKTISPTVMWATLMGSTVREELSATDIASLKCEY